MAEIEGELAERRRDQDEILIGALASGATDEVAAELAGCSARTVRRRRHDDRDFHEAVKQRRAERTAALTGRLVELADRAVDVLVAALDDETPRVRLRAAELVLSSGARLRRATEVDDEIAELKRLASTYTAMFESGETVAAVTGTVMQ